MENKLEETPATGNWRLKHQIDRIYGHLPTEFYKEILIAVDPKGFLDSIVYLYNQQLFDLEESTGENIVQLFTDIFKNDELLQYFFDKVKAYGLTTGIIKLEKELIEA